MQERLQTFNLIDVNQSLVGCDDGGILLKSGYSGKMLLQL